ncbi:MAG: hydantoinase B/oxoprolinase family protein, partial [Terriglobia bacterium]
GGQPGKPGRNVLFLPKGGNIGVELPSKTMFRAMTGSRLRIETPGGGGWGRKHAPSRKRSSERL